MVLEMSDDDLGPVAEIERAIRTVADANRTERRQIRRIGGDQIGEFGSLQAGAVWLDLDAIDTLKTDDVQVEEIALPIIWEVAAGNHADAGARAERAVPKLIHRWVLPGIEASADCRGEERVVARGVG